MGHFLRVEKEYKNKEDFVVDSALELIPRGQSSGLENWSVVYHLVRFHALSIMLYCLLWEDKALMLD